ncbi:hypothetical protein C5O25_09395 [Paramuribaculum intestinale]|uniref:Uncharacterized protein n=1 Tax=Paramuribaculum intestinale TaxID=2094151 RepID=A0A2V1IQD6_9BACT|nr:hypothetical protein [Paramuribaculum intestinale]PWB06727.1 hypothetical protein C5O25_09395 [Paramuribaculum intestinale]PWB10399.1 hypothetical protein C5O24_05925 [Paramuribaculum intestinale]WLT40948.1 hypothetical protein NF347_08080 [Paramuribaculum intestinale]
MSKENENPTEGFLGNIAEELGTLSGTCNEIKEAQLNCATTDDLAKFKDELDNNLVLYTHAIRTSTENCEGAVNQSTDQICDSITDFKDDFNQKFDDFRANPPVQKVEKTIRIARESWQWYLTLGFTVFSTLLFFAMTFWQEGRIEQCRISDIKYHYILMNGGVGTVGLDSIESWFNDPKKVKQIEAEVRAYEERVQETARALDQKHRLEEKINELNTQSQNSKK